MFFGFWLQRRVLTKPGFSLKLLTSRFLAPTIASPMTIKPISAQIDRTVRRMVSRVVMWLVGVEIAPNG